MRLLTVDLGNTRCKLRLADLEDVGSRRRIARSALATAPGIGQAIRRWLRECPPADAGVLCSVAGPEVEAEVGDCLRASIDGPIELRPAPGLTLAVREPERVGLDRLFAARGALELAADGAVVVDAGTALTVDAVRADRVFLGGAIAPGPKLLALALARGTARLPSVGPRRAGRALGRDTDEAVAAGIDVGFRGAARELAIRVAEESGLGGAPIVLTGGALGFLLEPSAFQGTDVRVEPELVHLGLVAALRDSMAAGRDPR